MASWGREIVIAQPAPPLAWPARYLAPVVKENEIDDGSGLWPIFLIFGGGMVFGLAGGGVAAIATQLFGGRVTAPVWVGFDLFLVACVVVSYVLVARYGLRFPHLPANEQSEAQRVLAAQGNTAWGCLPKEQRLANAERLRAMNAAARLILINADDAAAHTVLETNARSLHQLTLTTALEQKPTNAVENPTLQQS